MSPLPASIQRVCYNPTESLGASRNPFKPHVRLIMKAGPQNSFPNMELTKNLSTEKGNLTASPLYPKINRVPVHTGMIGRTKLLCVKTD